MTGPEGVPPVAGADVPADPQAGENTCPTCAGSGQVDGSPCGTCSGTGVVVEVVGDA